MNETSWSVSMVNTQLIVSTWFRKKNAFYVQLVTEAVPRRLLPFKTWYPLLPAALHRTTTDPQPASKRLHLPLLHLSNTTSLIHLTKNCPIRTPRRQAGATISAHVNMQHLKLHRCESPLKVAQLSRHINWDRSSQNQPQLFDLGVWDNYHCVWEQKRETDGTWWVVSSFPELKQCELLPSSSTNGRIKCKRMAHGY